MNWHDKAMLAIRQVHETLPDDISLAERRKAIDAAYPFGPREYHPYKQWLKARRAYLTRYGHKPRNTLPESPMERMMRRAAQQERPLS